MRSARLTSATTGVPHAGRPAATASGEDDIADVRAPIGGRAGVPRLVTCGRRRCKNCKLPPPCCPCSAASFSFCCSAAQRQQAPLVPLAPPVFSPYTPRVRYGDSAIPSSAARCNLQVVFFFRVMRARARAWLFVEGSKALGAARRVVLLGRRPAPAGRSGAASSSGGDTMSV